MLSAAMKALASARFYPIWVSLSLIWTTSCSLPPSKITLPVPAPSPVTQTGIASWYGPGFHGKPTASGVIYDQHSFTAAHQTLPLGTRVRVINLENRKSVEVLINDRGPFARGRIIDLSYSAAHALDMIGPGTVPVRIEILDSGPHKILFIRDSLDYTLQLGAFTHLENARQLRDRLAPLYPEAAIVPLQARDAIYYRVQLGVFSNRAAAEEQARRIAQTGYSVLILEK